MNRTQFNVVAFLVWICGAAVVGWLFHAGEPILETAAAGIAFAVLGFCPQVARQWERVLILRLGRFAGLRGSPNQEDLDWICQALNASLKTSAAHLARVGSNQARA